MKKLIVLFILCALSSANADTPSGSPYNLIGGSHPGKNKVVLLASIQEGNFVFPGAHSDPLSLTSTYLRGYWDDAPKAIAAALAKTVDVLKANQNYYINFDSKGAGHFDSNPSQIRDVFWVRGVSHDPISVGASDVLLEKAQVQAGSDALRQAQEHCGSRDVVTAQRWYNNATNEQGYTQVLTVSKNGSDLFFVNNQVCECLKEGQRIPGPVPTVVASGASDNQTMAINLAKANARKACNGPVVGMGGSFVRREALPAGVPQNGPNEYDIVHGQMPVFYIYTGTFECLPKHEKSSQASLSR